MSADLRDAPSAMTAAAAAPASSQTTAVDAGSTDQRVGIGSAGLSRARIITLTIGFVTLGTAAGAIFDRVTWTLIVASALPALVAVVTVTRGTGLRLLGSVATIAVSVALTVTVAGGSFGDVVSAFSSGLQGLLSTEWPSPQRPELLGTVAAALSIAAAASYELATRRRFHLLALLPLLIAYLGIVALSSPAGVRWAPLVILGAVGTVFALLRNDASLTDRLVVLRGERRVLPLIGLAAAIVVLAALPISLGTRANPRRADPAQQSAPLLDPIEATLALRRIDPPIPLHTIESVDGAALPLRWRTAALTSYDGRRWSPSLTLRPIGITLGTPTGPTIDADVAFLDDNLTLVPLPGPPISVDVAVETDAARSVVRLSQRPTPGEVVEIVANAPPTRVETATAVIATRVVDDSTSGLTQLAEGLAGDGNQSEQLDRLETVLREQFVLDNDVQGGGLEQALIDRFLRDTQRGTSEQFAAAFVMLARSLGIEARVATGFVAGDGGEVRRGQRAASDDEVTLTLSSADATVWPEVALADGRWIAYDPVPPEETSDGEPPPPEPQVQSPAAPQPPIAPPPESESETPPPEEPPAPGNDGALSTAITWVVRGTAVLSLIVLPLLIAAGVVVGVKLQRRRRRLRAPDPIDRIRGAWATATDALVDAGLDIRDSATDAEIADDGRPLVYGAQLELRRLSALSSAATYGTPQHGELLADDAAACLGSVERGIVGERRWRQRWRWRLSLRSLRRSTRSPVGD